MKKLLSLSLFFMFLSTNAIATPACIPRYVEDKGAFWFSALMLPPLLALNVMVRVGDLPNRGKHLHGLTCSTVAIAMNAVGKRNDYITH
jgi:hypothetical protein